jgi:hypothetical protein
MAGTWNKRERENKKQQERKTKGRTKTGKKGKC